MSQFNADFEELKKLRDRLNKLEKDKQKLCEKLAKNLAARLLSLVIPATPVGVYSKSTGKKGGTLRRGWTGGAKVSTGQKAKTVETVDQYSQKIIVEKNGDNYTVMVMNNVEYASYVEYGHKTRDHKGWVAGKYFLTKSEAKLRSIAPAVLEKELTKFLKEALE